MKDHEIAQLVNALRDCAVEFHNAQQLRERIAALVVPALRERSRASVAMRDVSHEYLAEVAVHQIKALTGANKGIRRLRRKLDRALEDIDDLSGACSIAWAAAAKAEPLRAPTPQDCVDIAEWHKSECEACCINPSETEDYGRAMYDAVRLVLVDGPSSALQQSSSGITAGAEKPPQVADFGAAAQTRTGDLLITNQNEKAPETSPNQDVTLQTPTAQPAEVVPVESIGCEGVTAALDVIRFALQDASRLVFCADETHPKLCRLARDSLLKAHVAWHEISAQWSARDPNARWLTLAHNLCTDAGVPSGHIADRLEGLRKVLELRA